MAVPSTPRKQPLSPPSLTTHTNPTMPTRTCTCLQVQAANGHSSSVHRIREVPPPAITQSFGGVLPAFALRLFLMEVSLWSAPAGLYVKSPVVCWFVLEVNKGIAEEGVRIEEWQARQGRGCSVWLFSGICR